MNTTVIAYLELDMYPINPRKEFYHDARIIIKTPSRYDWVGKRNGGKDDQEITGEEVTSALIDEAWMEDTQQEFSVGKDFYEFLALRGIEEHTRLIPTAIAGRYREEVWYEWCDPEDCDYEIEKEEGITPEMGEHKLKQAYIKAAEKFVRQTLHFLPLYATHAAFSPGNLNDLDTIDDEAAIGYVVVSKKDLAVKTKRAIWKYLKSEVEEHVAYLEGNIYNVYITGDFGPETECFPKEALYTLYTDNPEEEAKTLLHQLSRSTEIYVMFLQGGKIDYSISDLTEEEYENIVKEFKREENCTES